MTGAETAFDFPGRDGLSMLRCTTCGSLFDHDEHAAANACCAQGADSPTCPTCGYAATGTLKQRRGSDLWVCANCTSRFLAREVGQ